MLQMLHIQSFLYRSSMVVVDAEVTPLVGANSHQQSPNLVQEKAKILVPTVQLFIQQINHSSTIHLFLITH